MRNVSQNGPKSEPRCSLFASIFATFSEGRFLDAFWSPLGSLLAPFWRPWAPFWRPLAPFWLLFGSLWLPFGSLWLPLPPFGSLLLPVWSLLAPFASPLLSLTTLRFHFLCIFHYLYNLLFVFHCFLLKACSQTLFLYALKFDSRIHAAANTSSYHFSYTFTHLPGTVRNLP